MHTASSRFSSKHCASVCTHRHTVHPNFFMYTSLHVINTNRSSLDKTLKAQRHYYTTQTIAHFRGELGIVQSQCRRLLPHLFQLLFQDLDVLCLLFPVVGKLLRYLFELLGCFTLALPRIASSPAESVSTGMPCPPDVRLALGDSPEEACSELGEFCTCHVG